MELDPIAKLKRYIFLGNLIPVHSPRKSDNLIEDLDIVKDLLATVSGDCLVTLLKNHIQGERNVLAPRRNEALFVYAAYLAECVRPDDRKKACQAFPEIAVSDEDMFSVVNYSKLIQTKKGAKGHSNTIRKALALWYKSKSETDMIEMLGKNRKMFGLTHKDLITLSHISLAKSGLAGVESMIFSSRAKGAETADTKCQDPENREKIMKISKLKSCTDAAEACQLIESQKLGLDFVPNSLLHKAEVWQALLPHLTYRQLLDSIFSLRDMKLINENGLKEKLAEAIENKKLFSAAKLSPILMLIHSKRLLTKRRYSETMKHHYQTEKEKRFNVKENLRVTTGVLKMFRSSFDHLKPATGLKFFIAINLQASYHEKKVIKHKQLTCTEAAVALALTYFRSEKKVDVYTYTAMLSILDKLDWTHGISYQKAMEVCKARNCVKNIQRVFTPFWEANKKYSSYDVFLIIVPSGSRGNSNMKPDKLIQNLSGYRTLLDNPRTRVIVVNLRRFTPSMQHDQSRILDNGILEICGISENTTNIINAFATHAFS